MTTFSELSCPLCGRHLDEKLFAGSYTHGIVHVAVECPYCKTLVTIRARVSDPFNREIGEGQKEIER